MRNAISILALALALTGCKSKTDKPSPAAVTSSLTEDLSPVDSASALPFAAKQDPWDPKYCEPAPETDPGKSELTLSGTCAFRHQALGSCRARGDDYYVIVTHETADHHELEIYFNVEFYDKPGRYEKKVEVIALLRRGSSLYRWSNMEATVDLALEGEDKQTPTLVKVERMDLKAEPGTATTGTITLEGTIRCVPRPLPK